ncbi:putative ribonuclease H-like domain-containing protein [Tanacetum coccineum]
MDVKSDFSMVLLKRRYMSANLQVCGSRNIHTKVYKVEKALYGLHQAPKAWYETLSTYLLDNGFYRGQIDKTLFIKRVKDDILLVQVCVNDIIFGSTKKFLCTDFEQIMHKSHDSVIDESLHPLGPDINVLILCNAPRFRWQFGTEIHITGAEYIAASHCCGQVLWIQNQMLDYGYNFMQTKIHVDNESAICVVKNPVYHSKTKHIEIQHIS